jgi:hypothetical protein
MMAPRAKHVQGAVNRAYVVPDLGQAVADALGLVEQVGPLGEKALYRVLECVCAGQSHKCTLNGFVIFLVLAIRALAGG